MSSLVHGELYTPVSCTRWTLYTGVPFYPNCVPTLKNISLCCLARTLDNFLAKAVKFSSVLSVFGSKVFLRTICMAAIFLHICDWAGVWVSTVQLFFTTKNSRDILNWWSSWSQLKSLFHLSLIPALSPCSLGTLQPTCLICPGPNSPNLGCPTA